MLNRFKYFDQTIFYVKNVSILQTKYVPGGGNVLIPTYCILLTVSLSNERNYHLHK